MAPQTTKNLLIGCCWAVVLIVMPPDEAGRLLCRVSSTVIMYFAEVIGLGCSSRSIFLSRLYTARISCFVEFYEYVHTPVAVLTQWPEFKRD